MGWEALRKNQQLDFDFAASRWLRFESTNVFKSATGFLNCTLWGYLSSTFCGVSYTTWQLWQKRRVAKFKKKFIFSVDPFIFPNLDVVKTCKVKAGASISLVNFLDDNFLPLVFSNEGTPKKTRKRKKEESIETSLHKGNFQTCKRNSVLRFSG